MEKSSLIQHSDKEWSYGKYQIYWMEGILDHDPPFYEVYYKDHGLQYTGHSVENCLEWIKAWENFDG